MSKTQHWTSPEKPIPLKNMAESGGGGCFQCCFSFISTLGLTALFLWLSLRPSAPKCYIQYFYVPALNQTLNTPENTTIYMDLELRNSNKDKGVYYDDVNLTLSYIPNSINPIGKDTIHGFYQGHKKKAKKNASSVPNGLNWTVVRHSISINKNTPFRVDLATAVRYKIMGWKTKRHKLKVGANVEVNDQGTKVKKKGIKLSGASQLGYCCFCLQAGVLINFLVFLLAYV